MTRHTLSNSLRAPINYRVRPDRLALRGAWPYLLCLVPLLIGHAALGQTASVFPHSDRVRADLQDVLSAPEFRYGRRSRNTVDDTVRQLQLVSETVQRVWNRFWHYVERLFHFRDPAMEPVARVMVFSLIILFCFASIWVCIRIVRLRPKRNGDRRKVQDSPNVTSADKMNTDPALWLCQADALASAQNFSGAVRAVFMAILMRLDRSDAIRWAPYRSNEEFVSLLRAYSEPQVYQLVRDAVSELDPRTYGRLETFDADYVRIRSAYDHLCVLVTRSPRVAESSLAVGRNENGAP